MRSTTISKILPYILLLIISIGIVNSAGGGGGSGGGNGGGSNAGTSSSSGGGSGEFFSNLQCDDTGKITFSRKPILENIILKNLDDKTEIRIIGQWDGTRFTSEEALVIKAGDYILKDTLLGDQRVTCPGLRFSCKLVEINIKECSINEDKLSAEFTLKNTLVNDIRFEFRTQEMKRLTYQNGAYSNELKGLSIKEQDGIYRLELKGISDIKTLQILHPKCIGRYYAYSTMDCSKKETQPKKEETGRELKCGGYLNIEDRVRCRIELREEERNEYENFFPEECKSRADEEECLKVYQSVQKCWAYPNGDSRINCVKAQLNLGNIITEKEKCKSMESKTSKCMTKLKDKVNSLIKFRLYNLEELAEELMEEGKLNKEEVIDFVVKMENSKFAFNLAKTKSEKKAILLQARDYWNELIKKKN